MTVIVNVGDPKVLPAREGERGMLEGRGDYDWTEAGRCSRHDTVALIDKPFYLPMPTRPVALTAKQCPTLTRITTVMERFNDGQPCAVWPIYGFGEQHGSVSTVPRRRAR